VYVQEPMARGQPASHNRRGREIGLRTGERTPSGWTDVVARKQQPVRGQVESCAVVLPENARRARDDGVHSPAQHRALEEPVEALAPAETLSRHQRRTARRPERDPPAAAEPAGYEEHGRKLPMDTDEDDVHLLSSSTQDQADEGAHPARHE